ncbi:peptidoglycan DD-metalloendopeptidase family protein [Caldinitratiruptor microaerophilus]|uniref:LysM domain-containing protein n=1 Tax=Caldinitratiruptor microaerophilus TaxID=671077 RepID=A0AA35G6R9_9FIRM|nr:M23 family metallopeptidase [Caldinitratiruptor microaerophilus]BDG61786.1 hypothetical protein caldi_28760 [Caldinitratiruptor microaerophilus]
MDREAWKRLGLLALGCMLSFTLGWRRQAAADRAFPGEPAAAALAPLPLGVGGPDVGPQRSGGAEAPTGPAGGGAGGQGPAAAAAGAGVPGDGPPPGRPATYTVRTGDTLGAIARRLGVKVEALRVANGLTGDTIFPGQVLTVPGERPTEHVVRAGDTAWDIARLYGITLEELAAVNPDLEDLGLLQVGQALRLPAGARWQGEEAAPDVRIAPDARFVWPASGPISSPYGPRWGRFHSGIDIAANAGDPILAARAGVVDLAGWVGGYGNTVILRHADGSRTLYAHSSRVLVRPGDRVRQGQVIARVGSTGRSTGPHLHFELIAGRPVDPMRYLPRRGG